MHSITFQGKTTKHERLLLSLGIIIVAILPWARINYSITRNIAALFVIRGLESDPNQLYRAQSVFVLTSPEDCRSDWLKGAVADALNLETQKYLAWFKFIRCAPEYLPLLKFKEPDDQKLAEYSVKEQPGVADAWFWLADTLTYHYGGTTLPIKEQDRIRLIQIYQRGLSIKPTDGAHWFELGDLLFRLNPRLAIASYLLSCINGDPGYNGCYRAGTTAEQLGNIEEAIRYYRLSFWDGALQRADVLEQQFATPSNP